MQRQICKKKNMKKRRCEKFPLLITVSGYLYSMWLMEIKVKNSIHVQKCTCILLRVKEIFTSNMEKEQEIEEDCLFFL